jgi:DNA-binding winged helix-turn-helix (wHTH) protein
VRRIRFDDTGVRLDLQTGEFEGANGTGRLTPLSLRLVAHLVHNHERVVPKDELLRDVWEGTRVGEDSLRQALRVLRRELADASTSFVENVRGRGYRLAAPFREEEPEDETGRLLGRGKELGSLLRDLESARTGRGRVTSITGAPGIGKSLLLAELAGRAARRGFHVVRTPCPVADELPDLWIGEQILRDLVDGTPELLGGLSASDRSRLRQAFSWLREATDGREAATLDGPVPPEHLHEAVTRALLQAADERPLLLCIDDWLDADADSVELLARLAARIGDRRVALVVTHRAPAPAIDRALLAVARRLRRMSHARELPLRPLERETVVAAALGVLEGDESGAESIWVESGGNPCLLRIALERARREGTGPRAQRLDVGARERVLEHLGSLSEEARRVLAVAAVLGGAPRREDLSALVDGTEAVGPALDESSRSGLLRESPDGRLLFANALVAEALRESLDRGEREALHARAAVRLAASADPDPALMAEHAFHGRAELGAEAAAEWCERAAGVAARHLRPEDAAIWLERALACADEASPRDRLRLLVALADARARAHGSGAAEPIADRAVALARALGDGRAEARAVCALGRARGDAGDPPDLRWRARIEQALSDHRAPTAERIALLGRLADSLGRSLETEAAHGLAREALAIAERSDDTDARVEARVRTRRVFAAEPAGDAPRTESADGIASLLSGVHDRLLKVEACLALQEAALTSGDRARMRHWAARLAREARAVGGPHARWYAYVSRASLAHLDGDLDAAERLAGLARKLGEEAGIDATRPVHGFQIWCIRSDQGRLDEIECLLAAAARRSPASPAWTLGWRLAQLHGGSAEPARELLRSARDRGLDELARDAGSDWLLAWLANGAVRLDDVAMAETLRPLLRERAHRHARSPFGLGHGGSLAGHLGRVERLVGDLDAAVAHLEEGLERDRGLGALACVARGEIELAAALRERGSPGDDQRTRELEDRGRRLAEDLGVTPS